MARLSYLFPLLIVATNSYGEAFTADIITGRNHTERQEKELPLVERTMARLDSVSVSGPEGIWEYPLDEVSILIQKDSRRKGEYSMIVLEALDTRLHLGDTIGTLLSTPDSEHFKLRQFTERKNNLLSGLKDFEAKLSGKGSVLLITSFPKIRLSFSPWRLLPKFLQMVRLKNNSGNKTPEGLRKIYPPPTTFSNEKEKPLIL